MSPNTFHAFPRLPTELRHKIFNLTNPSTTTINILEDDFEIPQVSLPPGLLTTTSEARTIALKWDLKKYPIYTTEDWQDIYLSSEATTLQLIISPSKTPALNITWTELHAILGDALTEARYLHIVCSEPKRLARLFMLPEGEIVGVGESCVERGLFGKEVVASDRKVRECLQGEVLVTTSEHTVEEIGSGQRGDVKAWRMVEEEVVEGFGVGRRRFSTKAFERVEVQQSCVWKSVHELHDAAKGSVLVHPKVNGDAQPGLEDYEVEKSGVELTEEALERHLDELVKLYPETADQCEKADAGGSIMPAFD